MRRYWTCRKCHYRQERRTNSRKCLNCGEQTRRETNRPAHEWPLEKGKDAFQRLNVIAHGVGPNVCAICHAEGRALQRDHAHHDGGFPRGMLCGMCNKRLGEVEHGNDAAQWLKSALAYVLAADAAWELAGGAPTALEEAS